MLPTYPFLELLVHVFSPLIFRMLLHVLNLTVFCKHQLELYKSEVSPRLSSLTKHGTAGGVSFSSFRRASAITLK